MPKQIDWHYYRKGWISSGKASKFVDASKIVVKQSVPASRKLGRAEAAELVAGATRVIVAKGNQVRTFSPKSQPADEIIVAMLGSTGNLRAPTIRVGKTVIVGFNADVYHELFA